MARIRRQPDDRDSLSMTDSSSEIGMRTGFQDCVLPSGITAVSLQLYTEPRLPSAFFRKKRLPALPQDVYMGSETALIKLPGSALTAVLSLAFRHRRDTDSGRLIEHRAENQQKFPEGTSENSPGVESAGRTEPWDHADQYPAPRRVARRRIAYFQAQEPATPDHSCL